MGGIFIRKVVLNMNEMKKYEVIKKLVETNGNKQRAAITLQVTVRQINRMINGYREHGKAFFVHGNRGSKPINAIPDYIRHLVVDLYRSKYFDANFTHFTELLSKYENINLSVSTVSSILESEYILSPKVTRGKQKRIKKQLIESRKAAKTQKEINAIQTNIVAVEDAHSRRPRCANFGELLQMDASSFLWFGSKETTLHIAVDDATGMITGAYFDNQETLNGYYHIFHQILTQYGIPYKFFTDCRTVFTYKLKKNADLEDDTYTQFAYACKQLGVELECSSVPQAKGRVERMFQTLQSRLPVDLRLEGVTDLRTANEFLNSYIKEFNAKFALPVHSIKSVFENQPEEDKINLTLSVITERVVDCGHCIQLRKKHYKMLDSKGNQIHYLKGTKCMVIQSFDNKMYCCVNDKDIYALEEIPEREAKSKDFDFDYEKTKKKEVYIPPMNHPWRRQAFAMFAKKQKHRNNVDEKTA